MSSSIFSDALRQASTAIISGDPQLWEIILLSFRVSLSALALSLIIGLPLALALTLYRFPGYRVVQIVVDTLMALPPVVVGLIIYLLISRSGPFGIWGLLYTPKAMIIAQTLLITPIVIALGSQLFKLHWQGLKDQLLMLGFKPIHYCLILIQESRSGLITVVLAAFGRAIAEIGAVMVVGGNIEHQTRVMTTAIAMETRQGNLSMALALGLILIGLALLINTSVHMINRYPKQGENFEPY